LESKKKKTKKNKKKKTTTKTKTKKKRRRKKKQKKKIYPTMSGKKKHSKENTAYKVCNGKYTTQN
jgi:hypothetical protein